MGSIEFSLSVVLPVFNEEKNILKLFESAQKILPTYTSNYELIFVDDGSRDGSRKIIQSLTEQYPLNVKLFVHETNEGYGATLRDGINQASKKYILLTDSDLQFSFSSLKDFIPRLDSGVVCGYRSNRHDDVGRKFLGRTWTKLVSMTMGINSRDVNCAFKIFKSDILKSIPLTSRGALINAEIFYWLKKRGVTFFEVPVEHFPRTAGTATGARLSVILRACKELFFFKISHLR